MVDDQRFASKRPDVVTYQTDPLEEDITIAGPISPKLKVTSTGTDSDFVVKLIDVYPSNAPDPDVTAMNKRVLDTAPIRMGGYQQLVRGEPMRAKFRDSWSAPTPLTPGKITAVDFTMPDLLHTFRKGHRIMVQVQSSWFPLTDRNPQTFTDIPHAKPEEFKKATEEIYHEQSAPSGIELMILPQP
jgi:putative CocE/NonD family hydrolase